MRFFWIAILPLLIPVEGNTSPPANVTLDDLQKKGNITCRDVMSFVSMYPVPSDPDVNQMWLLALQFCYSKVALLSRLQVAKKDEAEILRRQIKRINIVLGPIMHAIKLSFFVFSEPYDLRAKLLDIHSEVSGKGGSIFQLIQGE